MAHPGGRPLEYNYEELEPKVLEYLASCEDYYDETRKKVVVKLPTIEGLALHIGFTKVTIFDWEKKYPEFSYLIDKLRQKQAERLVNNGLSGDYNSVISKVLLTKHGYREGVEQTGADGKDLIPESIPEDKKNALLALLNDKESPSESN